MFCMDAAGRMVTNSSKKRRDDEFFRKVEEQSYLHRDFGGKNIFLLSAFLPGGETSPKMFFEVKAL